MEKGLNNDLHDGYTSQGLWVNPSMRNLLLEYVSGRFEMSPGLVGNPSMQNLLVRFLSGIF